MNAYGCVHVCMGLYVCMTIYVCMHVSVGAHVLWIEHCVPPPNLYFEALTPNVMVLRGIIIRRLDETMRVGACDRINALIRKEETGELTLPCEDRARRWLFTR